MSCFVCGSKVVRNSPKFDIFLLLNGKLLSESNSSEFRVVLILNFPKTSKIIRHAFN